MKISMNWISEFVDLDCVDLHTLINRLTLSTAEVERVYEYGKDIIGVVAGRIVAVEEHPNSKKLHLVTVDIGKETISCVCGAPNVAVGITVPFVRTGGCLMDKKIEKAVIAGVESNGMCCSEKELGISDDSGGLMILDNSTIPGTDITTLIPIRDTVFEIDNKSLTNRPDLWCHYGFAREIAAILSKPLKPLDLENMFQFENLPELDIKISDSEKCLRYTGLVIENVTEKISPVNMRIRLFYCGMRAINLLADMTNYVMLEIGQPMHAFDRRIVDKISVKTFETVKEFTTLDGVTRSIDSDTLMICNENSPMAIAGIMGGELSEVKSDTTSIFLESACFDGVSTRKSSGKLGLRTESSSRYEKTLDPEITYTAICRFVSILRGINPHLSIASRVTDVYVRHYPAIELDTTHSFISKYIGADIGTETITSILTSLNFKVDYTTASGCYHVTVPSFRATKDVTLKVDLIEEITRIYGYDNIVPLPRSAILKPVIESAVHENEYSAKRLLVDRFSLNEIHSYIWGNARFEKEMGIATGGAVRIINSISPENSVLRGSIVPSLLYAVNENKVKFQKINLFEIGRVVDGLDKKNKCIEKKTLGVVLADRVSDESELLFKLKEIIGELFRTIKHTDVTFSAKDLNAEKKWTHPVNCAEFFTGDTIFGYMSVLHPSIRENIDKRMNIVVAEIDFNAFSEMTSNSIEYKDYSKFPSVEIDLNLLTDKGMLFSTLKNHIDEWHCSYLEGYSLMDVYEDDIVLNGKRSYTLKFTLTSHERTLSGEDIESFTTSLLGHLRGFGIVLRQ